MQYLGRALKRRSNRRHFNSLPRLLQESILAAQEVTGNRWPARREIKKQIKKSKSKREARREKRNKHVTKLVLEAKRRLKKERADKKKKETKKWAIDDTCMKHPMLVGQL